jgi:SAM-dependent methyltransferase
MAIAERFMPQGSKGYEFGAMHSPWPNPNGAKIQYVEKYEADKLAVLHSDIDPGKFQKDVIFDDMQSSNKLNTGQDFVIHSHVLEHCWNPIKALATGIGLCKRGGHLLFAVPERSQCFDKMRADTSLDLLMDVFDGKLSEAQARGYMAHDYMWHVNHSRGEKLRNEVKLAMIEVDVHFCCWGVDAFREFLDYCHGRLRNFETVSFEFVHHEMLVVLEVK